jgi:hypothetical protein
MTLRSLGLLALFRVVLTKVSHIEELLGLNFIALPYATTLKLLYSGENAQLQPWPDLYIPRTKLLISCFSS